MRTLLEFGQRRGAVIGATLVLHTWTRELRFHPHVHAIVTGGGLALDAGSWKKSRRAFLFPIKAMARVLRGKMIDRLKEAQRAGAFTGFDDFDDPEGFQHLVRTIAKLSWIVYAKPSFSNAAHVVHYLGRYTHRVAISNSRLLALDEAGVSFRYKDYRRNGQARYRTMTLEPGEFIRRFLLHVLPRGFHRIRHYGLLASATCKANIARARTLIAGQLIVASEPPAERDDATATASAAVDHRPPCPCCGGRMIIVETFERCGAPRAPPAPEPAITTKMA
jgi:hypothetical protein